MQVANVLFLVAIAAMVFMSFIVARKIPSNQLVPMQFAPGSVAVWSAPRWVAMSFMPVLAVGFNSLFVAVSSMASPLNSAAETLVVTSLRIPTIVLFVVGHALYLYSVTRWIARQL